MSNAIELALTSDEALVVFEWLSELGPDGLGDAEKIAIDGLISSLEGQLSATLDPNYLELVAAARARLIASL